MDYDGAETAQLDARPLDRAVAGAGRPTARCCCSRRTAAGRARRST